MCSCNQSTIPETTLNSSTPSATITNDTSPTVSETPNIEDYDITIFSQSGFGGDPTNSMDVDTLEKLGLLPKGTSENQVDDTWKDKEYEFTICENTYKAPYSHTFNVFPEDADNEYIKRGESHLFGSMDNCYIKISKKTGKLIFLYVKETSEQMKNSSALIPYYSGEYIKEKMPEILVDIYGEEILEYLDTYYTFEYAKKDKDFAGEGYMVLYRAYIDGIPTDDTLTVWLTLDRKLWSVSAPNFLEYSDIDVDDVIPVEIMDQAIDEYLKTNSKYENFEPYTEGVNPPKYFFMNAYGELYYQTCWITPVMNDDLGIMVDHAEWVYIKAEK